MEKEMKGTRKIVDIDQAKCNGCGECVSACAEGAIELVNGKARLSAEKYCDGLAACLTECPQRAISIVEREADTFDPEAVEHHLTEKGDSKASHPDSRSPISGPQPMSVRQIDLTPDSPALPCGCPSTQVQRLPTVCGCVEEPTPKTHNRSTLTHWPVQIRLVPITAPFLKNADLLIASDCTPLAYPNFHEDFLKGRVVMMGCPKLDDTNEYIKKFADIFRAAHIKSIAIVIMEVPCCSKMPLIVQQGMEMANKAVPTEIVVIGARGNIIRRMPLTA